MTGPVVNNADHMVLRCPRCAGEYLHHRAVTAYSRVTGEDSQHTMCIRIEAMTVSRSVVASSDCPNPSLRRDGLVIELWCEDCGEDRPLQYQFAQHKGMMLLTWGG